MSNELRRQILVAVLAGLVSPVLIGLFVLIIQAFAGGAIVDALGGVIKTEFVSIPKDAIILVDSPDACENNKEWTKFAVMEGKTLPIRLSPTPTICSVHPFS